MNGDYYSYQIPLPIYNTYQPPVYNTPTPPTVPPPETPEKKSKQKTTERENKSIFADYSDAFQKFNLDNDKKVEGYSLDDELNAMKNPASLVKTNFENLPKEMKHYVYVEHTIKQPEHKEKQFIGCYSGSFISNPKANIIVEEDMLSDVNNEVVKVSCVFLGPGMPSQSSEIFSNTDDSEQEHEPRSLQLISAEDPTTANKEEEPSTTVPTTAATPENLTINNEQPALSTVKRKMLKIKQKGKVKNLEKFRLTSKPSHKELTDKIHQNDVNWKKVFKLYAQLPQNKK